MVYVRWIYDESDIEKFLNIITRDGKKLENIISITPVVNEEIGGPCNGLRCRIMVTFILSEEDRDFLKQAAEFLQNKCDSANSKDTIRVMKSYKILES